MSALLRNFNAKLCCLVNQRKKNQNTVSPGEEDRAARLPPAQPALAALSHCPRLPFPATYEAEIKQQKGFLSSQRHCTAPVPHLLLVRIRAPLALGLDQTPPCLGCSGALRRGDLNGQRRLELLDGDFVHVHVPLVGLLPAPVLQALRSH